MPRHCPNINVCALVTVLLSLPARAVVALPPHPAEGLQWAANTLQQAAPQADVRCLVVDAPDLGGEGFALSGQGTAVVVAATAWPGLMYGLLELHRRAVDGLPLVAGNETSVPALRLRAVSRNLDMYLGVSLYGDCNRGYAPHDRHTDWWFHDEARWRTTFQRLAGEGYNGVVLLHPLLFPAFLDYSGRYPEAIYLAPQELAAKQDALRTAIRLGLAYNIRLHWLRWNIWVPDGFAAAHQIAESGVDSSLTRELETWSVAELYRLFPGFGSIISQCGEAPPGCTEFIRDATVPGLEQVVPRPRHIVWSWCANPPDVKPILDAYDGETWVMNYLQYETLFTDRPDPRIGKFSEALGGVPMVALGGPKGAHAYLFWSDPEWCRSLMAGLAKEQHGAGIVVEYTDPPDRWLAEEAFGCYAWNPDDQDETRWQRALARRYGDPGAAWQLLMGMQFASRIVPQQVLLTHSQSGSFMPQLGLSLLQCLEMPSVSSYIFENAVDKGADGYLTPRMGKCWSSADQPWGQRVLPIRVYAITQMADPARRDELVARWLATRASLGYAPSLPAPGDRSTHDVPQLLAALARAAESKASLVPEIKPQADQADAERQRILELIRANAALGHYFAAKDRAAIVWEVYRLTGDQAERHQVGPELDASLVAWRRYVEQMKSVYGDVLWGQVSMVNRPAPWSQLDLWNGYVNRAWRLDELTDHWQREAEVLKERLATWPREQLEAPCWDELTALRPDAVVEQTIDFEADLDDRVELITRWAPDVRRTAEPELVLAGHGSVVADSRASDHEWSEVVDIHVPLQAKATYQVAVSYRVIAEGDRFGMPFAMAFRTPKGGIAEDRGDARTWGAHPGGVRHRVLTAELGDFDDYYLFFSLHGRAAIVLDDIRLARVPAGAP